MEGNIKSCKATKQAMAWANSYQLNTLQNKDLKNFINETGRNTGILILKHQMTSRNLLQ
jgi:hypothetical protein